MERQARRPLDALEWVAVAVPKAWAQMGERRASWMRLVALLVRLDELVSVKWPPVAQRASLYAARQQEARRKLMAMQGPAQTQLVAQAPQVLPLAE